MRSEESGHLGRMPSQQRSYFSTRTSGLTTKASDSLFRSLGESQKEAAKTYLRKTAPVYGGIQSPIQCAEVFVQCEGMAKPEYSHSAWREFVERAWAGPETNIIHIVYLPEHLTWEEMISREMKVVSEVRYELPAGKLPATVLRPADYFGLVNEGHGQAYLAPKYCNVSATPRDFSIVESNYGTCSTYGT